MGGGVDEQTLDTGISAAYATERPILCISGCWAACSSRFLLILRIWVFCVFNSIKQTKLTCDNYVSDMVISTTFLEVIWSLLQSYCLDHSYTYLYSG